MKNRNKKSIQDISDFDLMEELEYYKKPTKKGGGKQKIIGALLLLVIFIVGILVSPIFATTEIVVNGNEHFTTGEILEKISLSKGKNIFLFDKSGAEKVLMQESYIAKAEVQMRFPNTIEVTIQERKVRGYVPYMGAYLYIDEEGRVLETNNVYFEALPVVKGLRFEGFVLGEVLSVENPEALMIVLQISQMVRKYEFEDIMLEIDVADSSNIIAYVHKVQIRLGNMTDIDQKLRIVDEIMKTIPEEDRGTLDLSDLNKPLVFQYLT